MRKVLAQRSSRTNRTGLAWSIVASLVCVCLVSHTNCQSSFTCFMMEGEGTHLSSPSHLLRKSSSPPRRSVRIIVVRHGQSEANLREDKLREQGMDWENIRQIMLKETDSQSLVDATLTPQGIEQAKQAGTRLSKEYPNIKYVFFSPLRRTVDTGLNILSTYEGEVKPSIQLAPWAREALGTIGEIAVYSYEHLAKYPFIDRSALSANPRFWFLDYMVENPRTQLKAELLFACQQPDFLQSIADITIKCVSTGVEKPSQAKKRIDKLKEQLKNFISDKEKAGIKVQDDEILVVSHGHLLAYMLGLVEVLPSDIFVLESKAWQNTQIHPYDLEM